MLKAVRAVTPARIAATVGVDRERCRAASRVAIRGATGRRAASLPNRTSRAGTSRRVPSTSAIAPRATWISLPPEIAVDSTTNPPAAASTRPTTGTTLFRGGETLWPRMTPMMSSLPSRNDGNRAATTALSTAHGSRIANAVHGMSSGTEANLVDGWVRTHHQRPARTAATPSATPPTAEITPRSTAWASTVRRSWRTSAPLVAATARVRRCREALTAKAGPTSRVVMMKSMTPPITAIMRPVSWVKSPCGRSSAGIWLSGGGSCRTARL